MPTPSTIGIVFLVLLYRGGRDLKVGWNQFRTQNFPLNPKNDTIRVVIQTRLEKDPKCCLQNEAHQHLDGLCGCPDPVCCCPYRKNSDYDAVHKLSQVSTQITKELGERVWQNAAVTFGVPLSFVLFRKLRPSALPFIRGVTIALNKDSFGKCHPTGQVDPQLPLVEMLNYLSDEATPRLTFFHIVLYLGYRPPTPEINHARFPTFTTVPNGPLLQAWLPLFRRVRTDKFHITFPGSSGPSRPERVGNVAGRPKPLVFPTEAREMWMPDCLREPVEESEQARYLRLRQEMIEQEVGEKTGGGGD